MNIARAATSAVIRYPSTRSRVEIRNIMYDGMPYATFHGDSGSEIFFYSGCEPFRSGYNTIGTRVYKMSTEDSLKYKRKIHAWGDG